MSAGHPPIFDTPQDLADAIDVYFKNSEGKPATTSGLALHLGFASRQSLYDQKGRSEEFSYVIKRAILAIENQHETNLSLSGSPAGSIFWLKNHHWTDKSEMGLVGPNGGAVQLNHSRLTPEELEEFEQFISATHPALADSKKTND